MRLSYAHTVLVRMCKWIMYTSKITTHSTNQSGHFRNWSPKLNLQIQSTTEIHAHKTAVTISQSHQCGSLNHRPLPLLRRGGAQCGWWDLLYWLKLTSESANSFSHCSWKTSLPMYFATLQLWDQAYSQLLQLFTKLSELRLYLDLCIMFKIVHGLFHFPFLILTQAELQVLTDPFCFINPSPALTTSITRLSLVQSLYGTHYHSHLCLIVTYHILDHMYGCILHISSAILCILCYSA